MALTKADLKSRGFRNNNPLNLRYVEKNKWDHQTGKDSGGYCVFDDPVYGIRAAVMLLKKYQDKYNLRTIYSSIERFAPPEDDNYTEKYAKFVASAIGKDAHDTYDSRDPAEVKAMIEAMIDFENKGVGHPYTDAQIDKALLLAGLDVRRPLSKSRTVKTAQSMVGGGAVTVATGTLATIAPAVPVIREIADFMREYALEAVIALGVAGIVSGCIVGYIKWDERRRGVS